MSTDTSEDRGTKDRSWSRQRRERAQARPRFGTEEDRREYRHDLRQYLAGFGSAIVLTGLPFALVMIGGFSQVVVLSAIGVCAIVQTIVHFRYFLHIDLKKSHRDDLQLILFTFLIIFLMVAGTLWILFNLHTRMMQ